MRTDLHNHLGRNGVFPSFDKVIDIAHSRLGDNGIFSVGNCDDFRYENFVDCQREKYERTTIEDNGYPIGIYIPEKNISVLKSQEVFTNEGHILVIGMPKNRNIKSKTLEDTFKEAVDFNAITIVDHPFYKGGVNPERVLRFNPDGWEVYNASAELSIPLLLPKYANKKSQEFYISNIREKYNIGACAFTDGHSIEVIGRSYTNLDIKDNISVDSLRDVIRANKSLENLHMEPAKLDSLVHAYNMVMHKVFGKRA